MSRFYIGQQIKKTRGENNLGATATVSGFDHDYADSLVMQVVAHEPWTSRDGVVHAAGTEGWTDPANWEPLVPPGLESLQEINALYEPQGVPA